MKESYLRPQERDRRKETIKKKICVASVISYKGCSRTHEKSRCVGPQRLAVRVAEIPVATVINLPTRSVSLRFLGNNYPERLRPPELLSLIHPISQRLFGSVG